ncbi:hypothetical protein FRB96_007295 [Tulasnella sp. 330]|nr:hypothetical protein FRB96_007295 [Tulasnella sp. 330]KAG8883877.1 hypothetical protein FRB97_005715 [Tulasnella sp. 331]KAG8887138.1 hypothetical protein FRB98_000447 [Tulasnella sp. 332]
MSSAAPQISIPSTSDALLPAFDPSHSTNGSARRRSIDEDSPSVNATPRTLRKGKQRSYDDLRLLAVSAQITEIFYSLSDLQTRIFEVQELRHRSLEPVSNSNNDTRTSSDSGRSSTSVIDNALGQLDVRLESVAQSVASVTATLEPFLSNTTPIDNRNQDHEEETVIVRKYGDLIREWDAIRGDATTLREELKEDKWLAVFRTVSEQAEGMMGSLTKAVTMCQEFVHQVQQRGRRSTEAKASSVFSDERSQPTLGACEDLIKSFEAKKKYYMPSTTKVIQVLSKGIGDRVTKNGECLRKYADLKTRWDALQVKIQRVEVDMERVRRMLADLEREPSEVEFTESEASTNLEASPGDRASWAQQSASSGGSTLARLSHKVSSVLGRSTPNSKHPRSTLDVPDGKPQSLSRKSSFFPFRSPQSDHEVKSRPKLFHSTSSVPSGPPTSLVDEWVDGGGTVKPTRPRWNISTKPSTTESPPLPPVPSWAKPPPLSSRSTPPRPPSSTAYRPPSSTSRYASYSKPLTIQPPPIPSRSAARPSTPHRAAPSANKSQSQSPPTPSRPSSRAQSAMGNHSTPRQRPKTPSLIPTPRIFNANGSQVSDDDLEGRATPWMSRNITPSPGFPHSIDATLTPHRRRDSHIPIPTFGPRSRAPSRTGSPTMSHASPYSSVPPSATSHSPQRSQTPDHSPSSKGRLRHQHSASVGTLNPGRPSLLSVNKGPPSSFRESSVSTPSRPSSRTGSHVPGQDQPRGPLYMPAGVHDPLEIEVARIANSVPHGLSLQRVDPPLRSPPKPGEEVKAQYTLSNALGQKTLGFRLITIQRSSGQTKKVMCRVGGGWMDLSTYLLNRYSI